jgi:biopolymer transport protein ExbD
MPKYLLHATVTVIAFCVGVACTNLVNSSAGFLIDQYETAYNFASATLVWEEPRLIAPRVPNCGRLVVTVNGDGMLYLNQDQMGTLDNPDRLLDRVWSTLQVRTELHVYKADIEATSDVREEDRIEKSVYIRAPRAMRFGEVSDLIDDLKQVGAKPIGLIPNDDN